MIEIRCGKCGDVLFKQKKANLAKVLSDFIGKPCPTCNKKLGTPNLERLEINGKIKKSQKK